MLPGKCVMWRLLARFLGRLTPKISHRFLRGALIASLASAIAAGAILARQFDDGQKATTIRNLVKASYILSLGKFPSPGTLT
jgi:hypothetical protein